MGNNIFKTGNIFSAAEI